MSREILIKGDFKVFAPITLDELLEFERWVGGYIKGKKLPLDKRVIDFYQDGEEHRIEWGAVVFKTGSVFIVLKQNEFHRMEVSVA